MTSLCLQRLSLRSCLQHCSRSYAFANFQQSNKYYVWRRYCGSNSNKDHNFIKEYIPRFSLIRLIFYGGAGIFTLSAFYDLYFLVSEIIHCRSVPEQLHYFKMYVKSHAELVDYTGSELKIVPHSTNVWEKNDSYVHFSFDVKGQFGKGTVFVEKTTTDVDVTKGEYHFDKSMHLKIYAETDGDFGQNTVLLLDTTRYH